MIKRSLEQEVVPTIINPGLNMNEDKIITKKSEN